MKIHDIVEGVVKDISKTHFIVIVDEKYEGLVHISEISDYYVSRIDNMFKVGSRYTFEVTEIMKNGKLKLSWKTLKPRFQKEPFNFVLKETANGFKKLLENTNEEIKND